MREKELRKCLRLLDECVGRNYVEAMALQKVEGILTNALNHRRRGGKQRTAA